MLLSAYTHKTDSQAIEAIEQTLDAHPGGLVAHQNKIAVYLNNGRQADAHKAYLEMKKAAPYHEFTKNEGKRFQKEQMTTLPRKNLIKQGIITLNKSNL